MATWLHQPRLRVAAYRLCLVAGVVGQAMLFHATTGKYLAQTAKAEEEKPEGAEGASAEAAPEA